MGTERINFTLMQENYEQYRGDPAPCKSPGISNQCAVRMSLALVRNESVLMIFRTNDGFIRDERRALSVTRPT